MPYRDGQRHSGCLTGTGRQTATCLFVCVRARARAQAMKAEVARGEGARTELEQLRDRAHALRRAVRAAKAAPRTLSPRAPVLARSS